MKNAEVFYSTLAGCGKIFLKSHKNTKAIDIEKIFYLESNGNYTNIFSEEGNNNSICKSLCEFERQLKKYGFLRIHNSYMINLKNVKSYSRYKKKWFVTIADQDLPVSRSRHKDVIPVLIDFGITEAKKR